MISNIKKVLGEWELVLFVLSLLCSGVYLYATGTETMEKNEYSASATTENVASDNSDTADLFDFVFPDEVISYGLKKTNNPFYLKPPDSPKQDTGKSSADEEESGNEEDDNGEAAGKDEQDATEKELERRLYKIKYCGSIKGRDEKRLTLVKNVKKGVMRYVGQGELVLEVEIVKCGNKSLTVQLPSGESKVLKFGETITYKAKQ